MNPSPIKILDSLLDLLCILLAGSMTILVIVTVILRYVFGMTAVWSEELVTILFIGSSFFGTALAARNDEHITVDFIYALLSPSGKLILRSFISAIVIAVQVIVFLAALTWIQVAGGTPSPGLEIPFAYLYGMLPASCVLVCLYELSKILRNISSLLKLEA